MRFKRIMRSLMLLEFDGTSCKGTMFMFYHSQPARPIDWLLIERIWGDFGQRVCQRRQRPSALEAHIQTFKAQFSTGLYSSPHCFCGKEIPSCNQLLWWTHSILTGIVVPTGIKTMTITTTSDGHHVS